MSNNKIALITGATSGIGAVFACKLASQSYDLIITGRRVEKINALAKDLMEKYKVNVEVVITELANESDIELLMAKIRATNNLEILINNAGFTIRNLFIDETLPVYRDMLNVHAVATTNLIKAALPIMISKRSGTIINVSSIGAFFSMPKNSVYGATKIYVNALTKTLAKELVNAGIRMQLLCPGMTRTDIWDRMGEDIDKTAKGRNFLFKVMESEEVVDISLKYLAKNRVVCIPGWRNKILVLKALCKEIWQIIF
jgi:short-subunit dehydrogenase